MIPSATRCCISPIRIGCGWFTQKCAERGADYALGRITSVTALSGAVRATAAPHAPVTASTKASVLWGGMRGPGLLA